jgi:hypothetical protein
MTRGHQKFDKYPTAAALVMARTMKRVAVKHGDLDLARRAKELDEEARSALAKRQSTLGNSEEGIESPSFQQKLANPRVGEALSDSALCHRTSRYKVMVDDNFHYQNKDERREQGVYNTLHEAAAVCRGIVDTSLEEGYRAGFSAKELYDHYVSFGDDPFIVILGGGDERAEFSAWSYAKERCRVICQDGTFPGLTLDQDTSTHISESAVFSILKSPVAAFLTKLKRGLHRVGDFIARIAVA